MKKLLALLLALGLVLTSCGGTTEETVEEIEEPETNEAEETDETADGEETTGEDDSLQKIIDKGTLVLGTSADYPPYEFSALIDGKDEIVGFDIALGQYIADELGVELEIKDMDFKNLIGALNSGMIDVVIAGLSPDPKRDINFSDVYYDATHSLIVQEGDEDLYASNDDVKGIKVGVQMGTVQEEIAEGLEDVEVSSVTSVVNLILELKAGKYDGIIVETPVAESYVKANDGLVIANNVQFDAGGEGAAVGIAKGSDALTDKINDIIADVKEQDLLDDWIVEATEIQEEAGME